jgi:amino-acid N-acetyltransferase
MTSPDPSLTPPLSSIDHLNWFRTAAPYINMHRGKTFVVLFGGEAVELEHFESLIFDLALLKSLGIRLVLVHGARPQIDADLSEQGIETQVHNNLRVTTPEALRCVLDAVGSTRLKIEARFSMGLAGSPMQHSRIDTVSGNFVTAKPFGVRDGVDYGHTGAVRSIDTRAINNCLGNEQIVLLGPLGYSTTGEVYNLLAEQVAVKAAIELGADKLILMGESGVLTPASSEARTPKRELTPAQAKQVIEQNSLSVEVKRHLIGAIKACEQGVNRTHLISYQQPGSLLKELFTLDGAGTLVSADRFENVYAARDEDAAAICRLLAPMVQKGVLIERSLSDIERDLDRYTVVKRDGLVVGCAALYQLPTQETEPSCAEVASVAVHPDFRRIGCGERLIAYLSEQAESQGIQELIALTTQTAHWFLDQGFVEVGVERMPSERRSRYNPSRSSKIYLKQLKAH